MKSIYNIALFFIAMSLILSCEKDEVSVRDYPRINTLPVTHITKNGARFNAEFIFRGDFNILSFGFVWGLNDYLSLEKSNKVEQEGPVPDNKFSFDITGSLKENTTYFVKSFVVTDDYIIFGKSVQFYSLGSLAPEIFSFAPEQGSWDDTLIIRGKNFNLNKLENVVRLGDVEMNVIASKDSVIKATINRVPNLQQVDLSVEIYGNRFTAEKKFNYNKIKINGIDMPEAAFGDTLRIFASDFNKYHHEVYFGRIQASVISVGENVLMAIVPPNAKEVSPLLIVKSAGFADTLSGFNIIQPIFTGFEPAVAAYGDTLTIEGNFLNPVRIENEILFGDFRAVVVEASGNRIKAIVPDALNKRTVLLKINSGPFKAVLGNFDLKLPIITNIYPEQIEDPDQILEIRGINFNANPDVIQIGISHPNGKYYISKSQFLAFERGLIRFRLNNQVFPHQNVSVIGDMSIELSTFNSSTSSVQAFLNYRSIWTRLRDFPGAARHKAVGFSINGKGYFGTGIGRWTNDLMKDFWEYDPSSDTWTRIADFPGNARAGAVSFVIDGQGYVGLGSENYYWDNPIKDTHNKDFYRYDPGSDTWSGIADFGIGRHSAISFVHKNEAFVGLGWWGIDAPPDADLKVADDLWKYNAIDDSWSEFIRFPNKTSYASAFAIMDEIYVFDYRSLYKLNNGAWELLNTINDGSWDHIAFSINNMGYFGLGEPHQVSGTNKFVQYNPYTNDFVSCDIGYNNSRHGASAFVIGEKAYLIGGVTYYGNNYVTLNDVWEFDPSKIK